MSKMLTFATRHLIIGCRVKNTNTAVKILSSNKYSTKNEASFEVQPYRLHQLKSGPLTKVILNQECALYLYEHLTAIRQMENAASKLYKAKRIRGFCHLYIGEEACGVGIRSAMREHDSVITSYRCHAWTYLMGCKIESILTELVYRKSGCSRGKGGSMHMYTKNFYGGNGVVGAQTALGTGHGFAHKYKNEGGVAFTLYGDGAANQGQLFESYNIAKLWNLPVIFVCENNIYGMGTKNDRSAASNRYYTRGDYVPGIWVDGMDVIATRQATCFAIEYCKSGKGPLILEMETYRFGGHSMSDPGTTYRPRDEVQKMRETRDPIKSFKEKILKAQLVSPAQLKVIDDKVRAEVDKGLNKIKTDPEVGEEELSADIYKLCLHPNNEIRGVRPNAPLKHISIGRK